MTSDESYRSELLGHLGDAVKQVQMEHISKEDPSDIMQNGPYITNNSPSGRILYSCLEMILSHGLKKKSHGIWEVVQYFCRSDVIRRIRNLKHVLTNIGRGRAWIYLALNEKELESYLQSFQVNFGHISKYYYRYALICSSQVSVIQTLISGLDFVNFKLGLDFVYLDFSIKCPKDWTMSDSSDCKAQIQRPTDKGSVVHIDTQSIARTGHKAVGFVKEMLSHDSRAEKSMEKVNTVNLVAVNAKQGSVVAKKHCQDCNSSYQLVCFCVKGDKGSLSNHSMPSENAKILEDALGSEEAVQIDTKNKDQPCLSSYTGSSNSSSHFQKRVNPFNRSIDTNFSAKPVFKRFNQEYPIVSAPVEVRHRSTRRKKLSTAGSDISVQSDDLVDTRISKRINSSDSTARILGSLDDMCLSDPLIGFDPEITPTFTCIDTLPMLATYNPQLFPHDANCADHTIDSVTAVDGGENETCNKQLTQTNNADAIVISSQDSVNTGSVVIDSSSAGNSRCNSNSDDFKDCKPKMEVVKSENDCADTPLDGNKNNMKMIQDKPDSLKNVVEESASAEEVRQDQSRESEELKNELDSRKSDGKTSDYSWTETMKQEEQKNGDEVSETESISNVEISSSGSFETRTSATSSLENERINSEKLNKSEMTRPCELSVEEKRDIRKEKGMKRYRSQSEQLLNALTQQEVERLRAEIQMKLKPSRDRLEKTRKSIEEKNLFREKVGSLPLESSFTIDKKHGSQTSSSSSRHVFEDSSDDGTERDSVSSISQDTDSEPPVRLSNLGSRSLSSISASKLRSTLLNSRVSHPLNTDPPGNHKAVADIDNTLKLHLMLEILFDENEEILKLFHVSTGHSEGNWTALYLLFSDSYLYFLRSGDGNCPYRIEHTVSYEDLDYTSVGYNNQTIEFAFYTFKPKSLSKQSKGFRRKVRTKVVIDTGEKHLTDLIITILSKAIVAFIRRQSVHIKVCPPVFHDAREHQISLIKYLRQEGMTGDIQLYQLVHWEDPDFINAANMTKVSLEGTLKYKTQSFWGSSWKAAYFVLSGGILYQYSNTDREKPELNFDLTGNNCTGCKRIRSSSSSNSSLEFEVNFKDGSKLELCGYSDVDVTDWLQCLCMIVSLDQSSTIDKGAATDGMVINMLNHDALVPCGLIVADETLLLCHEDQHTGFCRTLAKARRQNISAISVDKEKSFVCEILVESSSTNSKRSKWGIFFPSRNPLELFLGVINSFSKRPLLSDNGNDSTLAHYLEARTLLDNRWKRTDNLLKGRGGSAENYTFVA